MVNHKLIVLTGQPGSGKTTLIQKLSKDLTKKGFECSGFFTQEVRNESGSRVGFDVVSIDNQQRAILSREGPKPPKIGKYSVNVKGFEDFALPLINLNKDFLIIDEIGKMELQSVHFKNILEMKVLPALEKNKISMLVTIPTPSRTQIPIAEWFRKQGQVFEITKSNRNNIQNEIFESLIK